MTSKKCFCYAPVNWILCPARATPVLFSPLFLTKILEKSSLLEITVYNLKFSPGPNITSFHSSTAAVLAEAIGKPGTAKTQQIHLVFTCGIFTASGSVCLPLLHETSPPWLSYSYFYPLHLYALLHLLRHILLQQFCQLLYSLGFVSQTPHC